MLARTPEPPYWAVIFTNVRTNVDEGYGAMAEAMLDLAARQPGYLGVEHARDETSITISYWSDLDSIAAWKADVKHLAAQKAGREKWYARYVTRIARVERDYSFDAD